MFLIEFELKIFLAQLLYISKRKYLYQKNDAFHNILVSLYENMLRIIQKLKL